MSYIRRATNPLAVPQSEPLDERQVPNSAGGYAYRADDWQRLERFLVLGSEGGTFYIGERKLTLENTRLAQALVKSDSLRVVDLIVQISTAGRAYKQDPCLYVLALAASYAGTGGRRAAFAALPRVARTASQLFMFVSFATEMRGWGRAMRNAVADWYLSRETDQLAYQMVKYQSRYGWSHRDLLRMAHPKDARNDANALYKWALGEDHAGFLADILATEDSLRLLFAYEMLKRNLADTARVPDLIRDYRLTHELVPSDYLNRADVWAAILPNMPMRATLRHLGKLTSVGAIAPMADGTRTVVERLTNADALQRARTHPLEVLIAAKMYQQGRGLRGKLTWTPVAQVRDALSQAYELCFANVRPTGQRIMIGIDVSGSMHGTSCAGTPALTVVEAAGATAMSIIRVESTYHVIGFNTGAVDLPLSPRQRLDDVANEILRRSNGGTDCSVPIRYAQQKGIVVDAFVILTDSETWYGHVHPYAAFREYQRTLNPNAKLAIVAAAANQYTLAEDDASILNVVGFDGQVPAVLADFIAPAQAVGSGDGEE